MASVRAMNAKVIDISGQSPKKCRLTPTGRSRMNSRKPAVERPRRTKGAELRDPGTVRMAALAGVPAVLRDHGVDPLQMLAAEGLPLDLFDNLENRTTYRAGGLLLQHCAEAAGCEHFGLLA